MLYLLSKKIAPNKTGTIFLLYKVSIRESLRNFSKIHKKNKNNPNGTELKDADIIKKIKGSASAFDGILSKEEIAKIAEFKNFSTYFDNFENVKAEISEWYNPNIFAVENYDSFLVQTAIDAYNAMIGDINKLCNEKFQNKILPYKVKFTTLFKQILTVSDNLFTVEAFSNKDELIILLNFYCSISNNPNLISKLEWGLDFYFYKEILLIC